MSDFEDLRLIDLLEKFYEAIAEVAQTKRVAGLNAAGKRLQSVYDFFITSKKPYEKEQEELKNLFSSFNYAAVIANNAIKNNSLTAEDAELLNECLEIMQKCSLNLIASLKNN